MLRSVDLGTAFSDPVLASVAGVPALLGLKSLHIEEVDSAEVLHWVAQHSSLQALSVSSGLFDMEPQHLHRLCELKELRFLRLPYNHAPGALRLHTEELPDCLSKELTYLDLRGHALSRPPVHVELPELRVFIAFGQGFVWYSIRQLEIISPV
eukprot:TRINITY_DN29417_c0_g1_i4.p1 TRINITY_DN29417_c0_g1~~TRINITY_DN29417_c0_g1_i4.p1  ORF type:complete len:153 (+),score=25.73 TRINITY_DN29417_c0_g1_i4:145-603(+)